MMTRLLSVLILLFVSFSSVAEIELDDNGLPVEDMLKAFESYTGRWVGKVVIRPADLPDPIIVVLEQEGKYILDNTMFQMRTIGEANGEKTEVTFLYGYDRAEESYCCWQYAEGDYAIKYKVEWAEDGKSYTHASLHEDELGHSVATEVQLDSGKAIRWTSKIIRSDEKLILDQTGELMPKRGKVEFKKPDIDTDSSVAIFKPYTGRWKSVVKGKVTDFYEEPYETSSDWSGRFSLGGDAFRFEGTADNAAGETYEYLWINLYDMNRSHLMCWYHDSLHNHTMHKVEWDPDKRLAKQVPVEKLAWGLVPDFRTYLVDEETLRFTFVMKTEDGKLIVDESGEAKPVEGDQD